MNNKKIRVAIVEYGNLGKGIESQLSKNQDMELVCIFTRRDAETLRTNSKVPIVKVEDIAHWKDKIDIVFLCGGSAKDLLIQGPQFASLFNTVCSLDTHARALEYSKKMREATSLGDTIAMTSIGWNPGLFSHMRLLIKSILPNAQIYTFWGRGISQGHLDAIRKINGVKDARQYTIPLETAIKKVSNGETPQFSKREMHKRECYVVVEDGADTGRIENEIKNMPNYFAEYDTVVNFISEKELLEKHSKLQHGGTVIGIGETSKGIKQVIKFSLNLDSNPEFTSAVLIAYGRATYRMWRNGERGYKNFLDVPLKYLSTMDYNDIIRNVL